MVGIDYDCRGKMLYWTDVAGRTISRASLEQGAEPETIISSGSRRTAFLDYPSTQNFIWGSGRMPPPPPRLRLDVYEAA